MSRASAVASRSARTEGTAAVEAGSERLIAIVTSSLLMTSGIVALPCPPTAVAAVTHQMW